MKTDNNFEQEVPNILIVDDLPDNLRLLSEVLKSEGYRIRPVPNGELALEVAEKEKPSLILLDIMMPGIDGFEVCRRLKANSRLKDIPVIFISALNHTEDIVKSLQIGGVDYITKPFQAEEVKARVNTHLQLYRQSRELHELNATRDKFFSIIAHDLRSPFNGFLNLTRMLAEDGGSMPQAEQEELASLLHQSANSLFGLLENLLEWAGSQQGMLSFSPEAIRLQNKVPGCLEQNSGPAKSKAITIDFDLSEDLAIRADRRMFETVMRNLFSNAVKFTPRNGRILISCKRVIDGMVEITVRDSGIGMDAEMVGNLFLIDKKTGREGTEGEPSSGLGLLLIKEFVEKHGGRLRVESQPGKGSAFSFSLPELGA